MRRHDALDGTIKVFKGAGFDPRVERGRKHIKVKADRLTAVVGSTPSDRKAAVNAKAVAKRLLNLSAIRKMRRI